MQRVTRVTMPQVLAWRMRRQYLDEPAADVVGVAERLCGVQAQVASSAELAVAVRTDRPAGDELQAALYTDRTLVRMWAVRGTLHLLTARGAALQCAVLGALRTWDRPAVLRAYGITREEMEAVLAAVAELLPGRALTRIELVDELVERVGWKHLADVLRSGWGTLLKPAAAAGLLCHGRPAGPNRITFTSPSTALRDWRPVDAATAGSQLVRDYLAAYGPATRDDYRNWLNSTIKAGPLKAWFAELDEAGELATVEVDGAPMLALAQHVDELRDTAPATGVRLLGGFDQYVIAVSRSIIPAEHRAKVSRTAGWISPVVLNKGRIAGVWSVEPAADGAGGRVTVELFEPVSRRAIAAEVDRLSALHGGALKLAT